MGDICNKNTADYLLKELKNIDNNIFKHAITTEGVLGINYKWKFNNGYGVSMIEFYSNYREMYGERYEVAVIEFNSNNESSIVESDEENVFQTSKLEDVKELLEDVKRMKGRATPFEMVVYGGIGNRTSFSFVDNRGAQHVVEPSQRDFSGYEMDIKKEKINNNKNNDYIIFSILEELQIKLISGMMYYISSEYIYNKLEQKLFNIRGKHINKISD